MFFGSSIARSDKKMSMYSIYSLAMFDKVFFCRLANNNVREGCVNITDFRSPMTAI